MTVDRVGHVEPISPGRKSGRGERLGGNEKADTINLSAEAVIQAERYQVLELIKSAPETDEARIVELRQKMDDPAYVNDRIGATADKLLDAWLS